MCPIDKAEGGLGIFDKHRDEAVSYRTGLQAVSLLRWTGMLVCLFFLAKILLWLAAPFVFLWFV